MLNFIYFLILVILISAGAASLSLAPWVPTRQKDLERIFDLAGLKNGEFFYDLGCGNGKVLLFGGRRYQGANFLGLELAPLLYLICKFRRGLSGLLNVQFRLKNLYQENLAKADVVYIFAAAPEKLTGRIIDKLKKELKQGSRIITYAFPIKGWSPVRIDKPKPNDIAIYLYRI